MLATYVAEIEERRSFIDGIVQAAQEKGDDLDENQNEMITRASARINQLNEQMKPLEESRRIGEASAERIAQISKYLQTDARPRQVEYRSAGEYAVDLWRAGLGNDDARYRLHQFKPGAADQTHPGHPGVIPPPS